MTTSILPLTLTATSPITQASTVDVAAFLTGPALSLVISERIEQIEQHGYSPGHDLAHDQAELALAGKSYVDTYIDLALRPDLARGPGDAPECWPWQYDFWKEPGPQDQAKALVKAIALLLAELDRLKATEAIIRAARPLGEQP